MITAPASRMPVTKKTVKRRASYFKCMNHAATIQNLAAERMTRIGISAPLRAAT